MPKLIFFLLIFPCFLQAQFSDAKRGKLLKLINQELDQVQKLDQLARNRDADLLIRLSELYLEKARLVRGNEEARVLELPPEQRANTDAYYKESEGLFVEAQQTGKKLLRLFPNHPEKGRIYYVLGFNAKEFKNYDQAKKYFALAAREVKDPEQKRNVRAALAELYYNEQDYNRSGEIYQSLIKDKQTKWWTRYAYNLSWCYYKQGYPQKALSFMQEAFRLSSSEQYIDVSQLVKRDIGLFYLESNQVDEALAFYRPIEKDISGRFLTFGKIFLGQKNFPKADQSLSIAEKYTQDSSQKMEIALLKLESYEQSGNIDAHLKQAQQIFERQKRQRLSSDQKSGYVYQLKKVSSSLQKDLTSKNYAGLSELKKRRSQMVVEYYNMLNRLERENQHKNMLYQAETLYSAKKYSESVPYYKKALQLAEQRKDDKTQALALKGLLAALDKSQGSEGDYLLAYQSYLQLNSTSVGANKVYQKLFKIHLQTSSLPAAENIFFRYQKDFPEKKVVQEAMVAEIIDYYQKTNNSKKVEQWTSRIAAGDVQVSEQYAKSSQNLLTSLNLEKAGKLLQAGKVGEAQSVYQKLYSAGSSSPTVKANAAYNLATLSYEKGAASELYKWSSRAITELDQKALQEYAPSFFLMGSLLLAQGQFNWLGKTSYRLVSRLCMTKSSLKRDFLKRSVDSFLVLQQSTVALKILAKTRSCGIEERGKLYHEVALSKSQNPIAYKSIIDSLAQSSLFRPYLLFHYYRYSLNLSLIQQQLWQRKVVSLMQSSASWHPLSLKVAGEILLNQLKQQQGAFNINLSFPEEKFNSQVKSLLSQLEQQKSLFNDVLKSKNSALIAAASLILARSFAKSSQKIKSFRPPNKSPSYQQSFQQSLRPVTMALSDEAQEFKQQSERLQAQYQLQFLPMAHPDYQSLNLPLIMQGIGS